MSFFGVSTILLGISSLLVQLVQPLVDPAPDADGRKELVEVEGVWTDVARLKRELFEATFLADHPDIDYRIVT